MHYETEQPTSCTVTACKYLNERTGGVFNTHPLELVWGALRKNQKQQASNNNSENVQEDECVELSWTKASKFAASQENLVESVETDKEDFDTSLLPFPFETTSSKQLSRKDISYVDFRCVWKESGLFGGENSIPRLYACK